MGIGVAEYGYQRPAARCGASRIPQLWWDGTVAAIGAVLASTGVAGAEVDAIGLTGQMHGLVLLDAAGDVLRPAILWNDQRTAAECDAIRAAVGPERLIAITGNDALTGFTAPKLVWVRDHEPAIWDRIAHVLLPKDFVRHRLTGEYALDKADGAGHDPVRPGRPRLVDGGRGGARDRPGMAAADVRGSGGDWHGHGGGCRGDRAAGGHAGRRGRRRSGGERGRRRGSRAGGGRAVARDVGRRLRHDRGAAARSARPGPCLLPRASRIAGT